MVIVQGMRLASSGVVVGIGASFGLAKLIASLLFGVTAWDPAVFVTAPIVLTLVALVAAWIPARPREPRGPHRRAALRVGGNPRPADLVDPLDPADPTG